MSRTRPFFSIIIPTYSRPKQLETCLSSLTRLDYPRNRFEVIVVEDGSAISPERLGASFRKQIEVQLLSQPHSGPAAARNTGAAQARGTYLAFTDDDCAPATDWLTTLTRRFAGMPDPLIGGKTLNALPDNLYSTASQLLVDYLYTYYNADAQQAFFLTSNNLALSADRFHSLGGFDATFPRAAAEDREFCDRWRHHGFRMIYASEVQVYHTHPLTFPTFCRQHCNYGRGAFHYHQVRTSRNEEPIQMEPLLFYRNLLRYPLSQRPRMFPGWLVGLMGLSQAANVAGYLWEWRSRGGRERPIP